MQRQKWYYEIKFKDGSVKRRNNVTKRLAYAALRASRDEMLFADVASVKIGVVK